MMRRLQKLAAIIALVTLVLMLLVGCTPKHSDSATQTPEPPLPTPTALLTTEADLPPQTPEPTEEPYSYINEDGMTIATRICTPEGFEREEGNAYEEFIRNQALMPHGSPVLLYNGTEKGNQNAHVAVLSIDVGERDRQQCADAALRLRCEFLYATEQFDKINYRLTNGDEFPYDKYRKGYRLNVEDNSTSLVKTASADNSYAVFRKYCDILFAYAGTISVEKESQAIPKEDMRIGDIFVIGGSPGHCVIVMDMCENANGSKQFLLGQSYMPAQQIHILKNPASQSPWYSVDDLKFPLSTPEWTFQSECLKRMP